MTIFCSRQLMQIKKKKEQPDKRSSFPALLGLWYIKLIFMDVCSCYDYSSCCFANYLSYFAKPMRQKDSLVFYLVFSLLQYVPTLVIFSNLRLAQRSMQHICLTTNAMSTLFSGKHRRLTVNSFTSQFEFDKFVFSANRFCTNAGMAESQKNWGYHQ